jgi:pimeloyl-ACP methyl ester carboxylesterase
MSARATTRSIAGVETYWLEGGAGRPVILLHGLGASSFSWRAVTEPLAGRFRVIAPDFPGFGRSGAPERFDYSMAGFSRWLLAFMDDLGIAQAELVGNSMGGVVALMTAMDQPLRVGRLALLGTPTYLSDRPMLIWPMRWPVIGRLYERLLGPSVIRAIARTAYKDPSLVTAEVVEEYSLSLRRPEGRRAAARFLRNAVPPDAHARLARYCDIAHEILVICGDSDGVVGLSSARRFCAEAPRARLLELADCGHVAQEEKPQLVAQALLEFLAHGR